MSLVLPVQGNGRRGVHEAAGPRRDTVLLQRRLQCLCAWRMCGEFSLLFFFFILYFTDLVIVRAPPGSNSHEVPRAITVLRCFLDFSVQFNVSNKLQSQLLKTLL